MYMAWLLLLALPPLAANTCRIVTFNIHGWRDAMHEDNFYRLVGLLQSLQPDVLCLNEVLHPFVPPAADDPYWEAVRERRGHSYPPPPGSRPDEAHELCYLRRLSEALGLPHWSFGAASGADDEPAPFKRCYFAQYPFGNAILSRHELADVRHVLMPVAPPDLTLGEQVPPQRAGSPVVRCCCARAAADRCFVCAAAWLQPRTDVDLEYRQLTTARVLLPGGHCLGVCVTHLDHSPRHPNPNPHTLNPNLGVCVTHLDHSPTLPTRAPCLARVAAHRRVVTHARA
jgi:endonuclease/exonuclease/phosphatase family metal-dependent hydrolase